MARFRGGMSPARRAEMLGRYRAGETQGALAVSYGVSLRTVSRVCAGTYTISAADVRSCLGCSRDFPSRSRWNRLCTKCMEMARTATIA